MSVTQRDSQRGRQRDIKRERDRDLALLRDECLEKELRRKNIWTTE